MKSSQWKIPLSLRYCMSPSHAIIIMLLPLHYHLCCPDFDDLVLPRKSTPLNTYLPLFKKFNFFYVKMSLATLHFSWGGKNIALCHLLSDCFWRYVNVRARYQKISSIGKCHKPFYIFEIKTNKLSMRERIRFLCIAFRVI